MWGCSHIPDSSHTGVSMGSMMCNPLHFCKPLTWIGHHCRCLKPAVYLQETKYLHENKAKAISAKLFELNLKVHLHNPVTFTESA